MPFIPIPRLSRRSLNSFHGDIQTRRKSSADVTDLSRSRSSLQGSPSRYLLKDHKSYKEDDKDLWLSSPDRSKNLVPFRDGNVKSSSSSSVTNVSSTDDQVVVLRVSIHCKGCEGKVRKHISKMEGVSSYTIDIATKKVIVVGKVTPLDVVKSISKVKFTQLWTSSFYHIPN